jgi:hypothetical protein
MKFLLNSLFARGTGNIYLKETDRNRYVENKITPDRVKPKRGE